MKKTVLFIVILGVFALWGGFWFFLYDNPRRGTFGDMFGAVNALFSGLAFVGVIYALVLQHDQLKQTEAEFNRNAQAQKDAAQLQALTLLYQEYKLLSESKNDEINRVIGSSIAISSGFYDTLLKERDLILQKKYLIFSSLEKTAGLEGIASQQVKPTSHPSCQEKAADA